MSNSEFSQILSEISKAKLSREEAVTFLQSGDNNPWAWAAKRDLLKEKQQKEQAEESREESGTLNDMQEYLSEKFGEAGKPKPDGTESFIGF